MAGLGAFAKVFFASDGHDVFQFSQRHALIVRLFHPPPRDNLLVGDGFRRMAHAKISNKKQFRFGQNLTGVTMNRTIAFSFSLALVTLLSGCAREPKIILPLPVYSMEFNTAEETRIAEFAGLGSKVAAEIVEQRTKRRFTNCGDLGFRVRSLGAFSLSKLSAQGMRVNGENC